MLLARPRDTGRSILRPATENSQGLPSRDGWGGLPARAATAVAKLCNAIRPPPGWPAYGRGLSSVCVALSPRNGIAEVTAGALYAWTDRIRVLRVAFCHQGVDLGRSRAQVLVGAVAVTRCVTCVSVRHRGPAFRRSPAQVLVRAVAVTSHMTCVSVCHWVVPFRRSRAQVLVTAVAVTWAWAVQLAPLRLASSTGPSSPLLLRDVRARGSLLRTSATWALAGYSGGSLRSLSHLP